MKVYGAERFIHRNLSFPRGNIELNVKIRENDTVWLTQSQMAKLLAVTEL